MPASPRTRGLLVFPALAACVALTLNADAARAQPPTPDQQAAVILAAGQKAYNDANAPFAAERFREFLQKFGGHKDGNAARYGLGLALLELQPPDYAKAVEALGPPADEAKFVDRPLALYYLAAAQRGLGQKELAEAAAKPNERPQRTQAAAGKFAEAEKAFTLARVAFDKKTPPDAEWSARARCDQAEMELRLNKAKEARGTAEPFAKDAALAKSKARPLGLYHHGVACFLLDDVPAAGKSLGQLAPFDQPFGPHARYLVGRVHAAQGEKAEAAAAYDAVIAGYDQQKKAAAEALKQPDRFKADPWEKARLEALVRGPAPDYVAGSAFYGACLNYEAGKFGEALGKFQAFVKDFPASPLKDDAALRAGFCLVQMKQGDEAAKVLQPLTAVPRVADQAFYWLGKAQVLHALAADPNNPAARTQGLTAAATSFRTAADRAGQLAGTDPEAKPRRAEIQLELADTLLINKLPREAANAYEAIWNEKAIPGKQEETLQRIVAAYHLAGEFQTADARIAEFRLKFPDSPLTPLVLFRGAENAYARAGKFAKDNNATEAKKNFTDAAKKYEEVVAKFPEFDRVGRARYGLGLCHLAAEDWDKAAAAFEAIPAGERVGDLAGVSFVLADCLIRTAPAKAEDALQDNMLREKLGNAAALLDAFVAANPKAPETADALLKYGYCMKRLGTQLAPGNERNDALTKARTAFERVGRDFPQSSLVGNAALERAKVMAVAGDKGGAANALKAFAADPLQKSPVAPLAYVALATLLREQNQPAPAAQALAEARQKFEAALANDPERREWVNLLRYHHGVALAESGKPAEARQAFDQVVAAAGGKAIGAEAALRAGQSLAAEARAKIEAAEKLRTKPGLKPDQLGQIDTLVKIARGELVAAGKLLERRADEFKQGLPQSEARARMLYDAAWTYRSLAPDAPLNPAGRSTLADAKADPFTAEMLDATRKAYQKLIAEFPALSLAVEARLELGEVQADAGQPDDAVKLFKDALDAEPADKPTPPETADRIRLRLGAALFAKKDAAGAQAQFDAVAGNEKSPHRPAALYRSAECLLAAGKFEEAKAKLVIFRDNGAFHNVAGVSDRAVLRLGHALAQLKQWDAARQAFETVVARYGEGNAGATDARYGMGWALQNAGRFDEAVNQYAQVTQKTTDDRAGRAQLQIGLCRAAQKRWDEAGKAFATVYYGYDLPDLKFAAMVEHARTLTEEKKFPEAAKLLERVVKDAPADGPWAKAAAELLGKLKK